MKLHALTLGLAIFAASFSANAAWAQEDGKSKIEPVSAESTTTQKTEDTPAGEVKAGQEKADAGAAKGKNKAAKAKKAVGGKDIAMKRQLAGAESRYRVRSAKLAKLAAVAEEKGDADMAKRVADLQQKNDAKHEQKLAQLREQYGADKVDGALKQVDKVAGNRKAAAAKVRAKAKTGKQLKKQHQSGETVPAKHKKAQKLKEAANKGKPKKKNPKDS